MKYTVFLLLGVLGISFFPSIVSAETSPTLGESMTAELVSAINQADYSLYTSNGDANFKAGISKTQFREVSQRFAPRFKLGYELTYLGELNQRGLVIILCRLKFNDGGDDALCTLTMKGGKLDAFGIR